MTTAKQLNKQQHDDLAAIMETVHGRRFIMRLLGPLDHEATVCGDSTMTYYNLGSQSSAHVLRRDLLKHHFDAYKLMLTEFYSDPEDSSCTKDD